MLFGVMAVVGYAAAAPEDQVETIQATEYVPQIIEADEVVDESSGDVIADEAVRSVRDSGAATEEQLERVAEAVGSTGGAASTRTVGEVTSDDVDAADDIEDSPAGGSTTFDDEPLPVPDEVIDDEGYIRNFIDWDSITIVEPPFSVRFDLCAGAVPGLLALPGCPDGSGATIVAFDDRFDGPALGAG